MLAKVGDERSTVRLAMFRDKYQVPSTDIDCAARIPLCGAKCCTMDVTLSAQDVAEGGIPFDVMKPYALPRDPATKKCVCMDDDGACTIYERRPVRVARTIAATIAACGSTSKRASPHADHAPSARQLQRLEERHDGRRDPRATAGRYA